MSGLESKKVLKKAPFHIDMSKLLVPAPFKIDLSLLEDDKKTQEVKQFDSLEQVKFRKLVEKGAASTISDIVDAETAKTLQPPVAVKCPWIIKFRDIPDVDKWVPAEDDELFKSTSENIYVPLHLLYKSNVSSLDFFNLKAKRCYNGEEIRRHFVHYINYFEKFYDTHHELFIAYAHIKFQIDYIKEYSKENLFDDIFHYIFNPVMLNKIKLMVLRNYRLNLNNGKKTNNVSLQYTDVHAILLLNFSIMQKLTIPLVTHFIYNKGYELSDVNDILMQFYYRIFGLFKSVDMVSKLYETVMSSVKRSMKKNKLWEMQNIRSINPTTHTIESVENIPLQLSPKYKFDQHIISFNFSAIRKNIGYKVLNISYNYTYVPLSSSLRDEDNNSKIDKYEANLEKTDENMHLFIKANKISTMHSLMNCSGIGPITKEEIDFYRHELMKNGDVINKFQQELVNLSIYKYFGDTITSKFTNKNEEYVALMIATKRLMKSYFIILPEIICGRVVRLVDRKSINKKEMEKLKASPTWQKVVDLYRNPSKEDQIMGYIAVILSSEFEFISYDDPDLNGRKIEMQPEVICEEFLEFCLMLAGPEDGAISTNEDMNIPNLPTIEDIETVTHLDYDKYFNQGYMQ